MTTEELKAVQERADKLGAPCDPEESLCPQCTQSIGWDDNMERVGICHDCANELNDFVPALLAHIAALESTAKGMEEALTVGVELAGIADDHGLGTDGRVEINGNWIKCHTIYETLERALSAYRKVKSE